MPSATSGFTGDEIISLVQNYTGNDSSEFQTFLSQNLALAEFEYCKKHEWRFLRKKNLSLTVASGTSDYTLNSSSIGYYMQSEHVERIFSTAANRYLTKVTLDELRQIDPDDNDGNTSAYAQFWAPVGDNTIAIWPTAFADTTLKIDGKITPSALITTTNYPTIPFHYQHSFIEYVKALALDREKDDRAPAQFQKANALIQLDIQNDMQGMSNSGTPHFRSSFELPERVQEQQWDALNMLRPGE